MLTDYTSSSLDLEDPKIYRDLSKPMGALTQERRDYFQERYDNIKRDGDTPFHYGTHYSSSGYVLQYLFRLEPYSRMALELQGGTFDHPDRLFHSIHAAWLTASGSNFNSQDVRELIPEFYYLPAFLCNSNKFDFGTTQQGKRIHDVELPPWANGSAHEFVRLHRKALESEHVSAHLQEWVDLVFGCKQRGREAERARNVFRPLTYAGKVDVDAIEDDLEREAAIAQIHYFGSTPRKLFNKPHEGRRLVKKKASGDLMSTAEKTKASSESLDEIIHKSHSLNRMSEYDKSVSPKNNSKSVSPKNNFKSVDTPQAIDKVNSKHDNTLDNPIFLVRNNNVPLVKVGQKGVFESKQVRNQSSNGKETMTRIADVCLTKDGGSGSNWGVLAGDDTVSVLDVGPEQPVNVLNTFLD